MAPLMESKAVQLPKLRVMATNSHSQYLKELEITSAQASLPLLSFLIQKQLLLVGE
jgi:hypothetical protein